MKFVSGTGINLFGKMKLMNDQFTTSKIQIIMEIKNAIKVSKINQRQLIAK